MTYKILAAKVEKILRQMGTTVSITESGVVVGKGVAVCTSNKQSTIGLISTSEMEIIISTKVGLKVGQIIGGWNMTISSVEPIAPDGVTVIAYTLKGSL